MEHKSVDYHDVNEAQNVSSESKKGDSYYDAYESNCDYSSDHSITSGVLERDRLHKAITPFPDTPADEYGATLQADESANTTWTDDKHSSYLDSIEATFVRKMYDKEYCSLDVCGHSSQSSMTWELECVESHPLCLNMRKSHEQPVGLLPFRASTRPWLSTPSVLASPWIQHFKAKQVFSAKNSEAQGNATKMQDPNHLAPMKNLQNPTSTMHDANSNALKSNLLISKKRRALFDSSDCMQFEVNSRCSHGTNAGGFKILKCQQALSQMDMVMEEQYNKEQQNQENTHPDQQNEGKIPLDVIKEELRTPQTGVLEVDEPRKSTKLPQTSFLKEKQAKAMCMEMGSETTILSKERMLKKSDQVVPSLKECCKEAQDQSIVLDKAMPTKEVHDMYRQSRDDGAYVAKEDNLSLHSSEQENTSTQLGSKTWTWGTQGLRYRLGRTMSPLI